MTERCEWCNHKAPDHDALCSQYRPPNSAGLLRHAGPPLTSAELLRGMSLPNHEEEQHRAAYGSGDVCGPASPAKDCPGCGASPFQHCDADCPDYLERIRHNAQRNSDWGHETTDEILAPIIAKTLEIIGPILRERVKAGEQVLATVVHEGPGAQARALEDMMVFGTGAHLTTDPQARKDVPLATGLLDYFPDALAAVAATSLQGSRQHHPDQPLHWDKNKSTDHADCLLRHLVDRGTLDTDGISHTAKVAWRALALLQTEIETMRETKAA